MVVVHRRPKTGQLVAGPDIVSRGFIYMREATELIESTKDKVRERSITTVMRLPSGLS